jgi:hypothetical protein
LGPVAIGQHWDLPGAKSLDKSASVWGWTARFTCIGLGKLRGCWPRGCISRMTQP